MHSFYTRILSNNLPRTTAESQQSQASNVWFQSNHLQKCCESSNVWTPSPIGRPLGKATDGTKAIEHQKSRAWT